MIYQTLRAWEILNNVVASVVLLQLKGQVSVLRSFSLNWWSGLLQHWIDEEHGAIGGNCDLGICLLELSSTGKDLQRCSDAGSGAKFQSRDIRHILMEYEAIGPIQISIFLVWWCLVIIVENGWKRGIHIALTDLAPGFAQLSPWHPWTLFEQAWNLKNWQVKGR